jgi:Ca2+-binding RTX toxin-like protein
MSDLFNEIFGTSENNTLVGSSSNDDIRTQGGSDVVRAGDGDDLIICSHRKAAFDNCAKVKLRC